MHRFRYLPLFALLLTLVFTMPEWESSSNVGQLGGLIFLVSIYVLYRVMSKLTMRTHGYIFVLGVIPDIAFTMISFHITGGWEFEANAWVGSTGSVLPIVPITMAQWGCIYLVRDYKGGPTLMKWSAILRCVALISHPILWMYCI